VGVTTPGEGKRRRLGCVRDRPEAQKVSIGRSLPDQLAGEGASREIELIEAAKRTTMPRERERDLVEVEKQRKF
jgi:hypothetical protein